MFVRLEPMVRIELTTSPYQGSALPLSYIGQYFKKNRAEDEVRTRDPQLGRLMLYQLSYFRKARLFVKWSA